MRNRAIVSSAWLGDVEWSPESELFLPAGLPGFEEERRMIPVEIPAQRPLVFLQSLDHANTCFVALPVGTIFPDYRLDLSEDDRQALLLDPDREPVIGEDVLCLVLLLPSEQTVEANLNAPIVINLHNSRCVQAVSPDSPARSYRLIGGSRWEAAC